MESTGSNLECSVWFYEKKRLASTLLSDIAWLMLKNNYLVLLDTVSWNPGSSAINIDTPPPLAVAVLTHIPHSPPFFLSLWLCFHDNFTLLTHQGKRVIIAFSRILKSYSHLWRWMQFDRSPFIYPCTDSLLRKSGFYFSTIYSARADKKRSEL